MTLVAPPVILVPGTMMSVASPSIETLAFFAISVNHLQKYELRRNRWLILQIGRYDTNWRKG
jgi:hypothetical protein